MDEDWTDERINYWINKYDSINQLIVDFCRAKTVRIGKWRWPPPKEDGTPGTAEGFFEFKMRKMKEKGWPQIHSCNIVIFLYQKYLDIISDSDEICASFQTVPRRFKFDLSSLAYFLQFRLSPKPAYQSVCVREGDIVPGANFQNILKQQLLCNLVHGVPLPAVRYAIFSVLFPEERPLLYRVYWSWLKLCWATYRARIFKFLRSPRIYSKESIPWYGTTTLFLLGSSLP